MMIKNKINIIKLLILCFVPFFLNSCHRFEQIETWNESSFENPPISSRVHVWYHWQNGHISKEQITRDMADMKDKGIGGVTIFNVAEGVPEGPIEYMSDSWWDAFIHAKKEARRLDLEMGVMNCAGWSTTAGPWVTPDKAMQEVVWTEKFVKGPTSITILLDEPVPVLGLTRDMKKDSVINKRYYVSRDKTKGYYRDISVLAYPSLKGELKGKIHTIDNWQGKAGFTKMSQYNIDTNQTPIDETIMLSEVINITDKLKPDGTLCWDVPEGEWTILRIGYQPTGRQNHPAPPAGRGLEINKMSKEAVSWHWKHSVEPMLTRGEEDQDHSIISYILLDSYEAGHQNWTPGFEKKFKDICGYDLLRFLPAITGRVVMDTETTEQFLWDFRKVINDLIIENYYKSFYELCHENDLTLAAEHYGNFGNTNDFDAGKYVDISAAEFWAMNNHNHSGTAKLASSTAHVYGRKYVGAEAFSGMQHRIFETNPRDIKSQGDCYLVQGINQFWLHGFTHDPYNKMPGFSLGCYGSNFNNRNTWWDYSQGWLTYLARCQYMLQQGKAANDILYFAGEDAPLRAEGNFEPKIPQGFDYDLCNKDILEKLHVENGNLVIPGNGVYRMLVVRNLDCLCLNTLQIIESLLNKGATVVMQRPSNVPYLDSDEKDRKKIEILIDQIWDNPHFYPEQSVIDVCKQIKLLPDFESGTEIDNEDIGYIHRRDEMTDVFFIHSVDKKPKRIEAIFRINDKVPELWDPMNGTVCKNLEYKRLLDGRTSVLLCLEEEGSVFVVFKNNPDTSVEVSVDASPKIEETCFVVPDLPAPVSLNEDWYVQMGENKYYFDSLYDWRHSKNPQIKYYSGTAIYKKNFSFKKENIPEEYHYRINLGQVEVIAELKINGAVLNELWKYPYQADITDYLVDGANELEIKVANLWVNKLIKDEAMPDDCCWTTDTGSTSEGLGLCRIPSWVVEDKESPTGKETFVVWKWPHLAKKELLPSGLIGPVVLSVESAKERNRVSI